MSDKQIVVVRVISETQVVLNVGLEDGIKENTNFIIYVLDPDDIIDPITKVNLGKLEIVKGKGRVIHLQEKMCTIESSQMKPSERIITRSGNPYGRMLGAFSTETEEHSTPEIEPFRNVEINDKAKIV